MVFVICRPIRAYVILHDNCTLWKTRLTRLLGHVSGDLGSLTRNNTVFSKRKLFKHVDHNFLKFLCYTTFDIWPERQLLRNWRLMKVTASHNVATRIISSYCDATPQRHWRQMTHDNARRAGSSTTFAVKYLWNTRRTTESTTWHGVSVVKIQGIEPRFTQKTEHEKRPISVLAWSWLN